MTHPYFFIDKKNISGDSIIISKQDLNHLTRVLRAKKGDLVEISDNDSYRYDTFFEKITGSGAVLKVIRRVPIKKRIPEITLFQCILKKDAMEMAIQKTVEIGVDHIVPVLSRRVIVNIEKEKTGRKLLRWQEIALSASKQSKRDFITRIWPVIRISKLNIDSYSLFYLPVEGIRQNCSTGEIYAQIKNMLTVSKNIRTDSLQIGFLVGPEGGFEDEEIGNLLNRGALCINFGQNILRSETASIYFLSVLDFILKNQK